MAGITDHNHAGQIDDGVNGGKQAKAAARAAEDFMFAAECSCRKGTEDPVAKAAEDAGHTSVRVLHPEMYSVGTHSREGDLRSLNLSDNYLFAKVMEDAELCGRVLEEILQVPIRDVQFVSTEESVRILPESKGIRMDVYVNDDKGTVYNVEMQTGRDDNLPKRARYYQNTIDLDLLSAGQDYLELKGTFIIFICTFPLFGRERHIYTFVNRCEEDVTLQLGDETVRIFLSTCGKLDDISKDLKAFLKYVEHSTDEVAERSESELVKAVNRRVQRIKDTREYQVKYMTLYLHEKEIERKAYAEGVETGQEKGREQALKTAALRMYARGRNVEEIAGDLGISREQAAAWIRET